MLERLKRQMTWTASIGQMTPERRADQCYGMMLGFDVAYKLSDEEFQELSDFWQDLRHKLLFS